MPLVYPLDSFEFAEFWTDVWEACSSSVVIERSRSRNNRSFSIVLKLFSSNIFTAISKFRLRFARYCTFAPFSEFIRQRGVHHKQCEALQRGLHFQTRPSPSSWRAIAVVLACTPRPLKRCYDVRLTGVSIQEIERISEGCCTNRRSR